MYSCLIAFLNFDWGFWFTVLEVCAALGLVIFVHELGHFAAAKACGVQVHKFYVGFDFFGWRICRFKWGETEYGIGAFPLGGYVKMLGQEDNPAQLREEIERAKNYQQKVEVNQEEDEKKTAATESNTASDAEKVKKSDAGKAEGSDAPTSDSSDAQSENGSTEEEAPDGKTVVQAERSLYNPRSYLQKSVPQRMAIISAGVIMNLIFAFIFAVIAFPLGVERISPGVGGLEPGSPAWQADVRVGDEITRIGENEIERFIEVRIHTTLGGKDEVKIEIDRPGEDQPIVKKMFKDPEGVLIPRLGITSPSIPVLYRDWRIPEQLRLEIPTTSVPATDMTVTDGGEGEEPLLKAGDRIVRIGDTSIGTHAELVDYLATHRNEPLTVLIERKVKDSKADEVESFEVTIPVIPTLRLGLVMKLGKVVAVQQGSPAEKVEEGVERIMKGDRILSFTVHETGETIEIGDPITLDARIGALAGKTVTVKVDRDGSTLLCPLLPREVAHYHRVLHPNNPLVLCSIGVASRFENEVIGTISGSPGDETGIKPGAKILSVTILPPKPKTPGEKVRQNEVTVDFEKHPAAYAMLIDILQTGLSGTSVKIKWELNGTETVTRLTPEYDESINIADRGIVLAPKTFEQRAESLGDAIRLGWNETVADTLMVYRFIQLLISGDVPAKAMGGPVEIFKQARRHAESGIAPLLLFLTMLSANLAVINFLPIPLFDGGQMVLLLYEGIRRKPASERFQEALAYMGLLFILTLMLWVLALDLGFISRT